MEDLKILQSRNILKNANSYVLTNREKKELIDAFQSLAKINKIGLSQFITSKASMTSESTLKYFEEKCGKFNKIQDQEEIIEAIKKDKIPYIDAITSEEIYPSNIIYINDRCYDKIQMKEWSLTFKDKTVKPKTPDTGVELTLEDIESLCLDPSIFKYTYAQEDLDLKIRLSRAIYNNDLKNIKYLVEKGVSLTDDDLRNSDPTFQLLHSAIDKKNIDVNIIKYLIENGSDINAKNWKGETPLILSAKHLHLEIIRYLIENGADINAKDDNGRTSLMMAIYQEESNPFLMSDKKRVVTDELLQTVKYLIENGADPNITDENGKPVLWYIAKYMKDDNYRTNLIKYLVENGANTSFTTNY